MKNKKAIATWAIFVLVLLLLLLLIWLGGVSKLLDLLKFR